MPRACVGLLCASVLLVASCAGGRGGPVAAAPSRAAEQASVFGNDGVDAPAVAGAEEAARAPRRAGLEIVEWATPGDGDALVSTLAELGSYAAPEGIAGEVWRRSGLRVFAVPAGDALALAARLPATRGRAQRWFGQSPEWSELLRGPGLDGAQAVVVDGEPVFVPGGTPRVLTRVWVEPSLAGGRLVNTLRTQLLVQIAGAVRREPWRLDRPGLETVLDRALEEGRSFDALRGDLRLDGSLAVVLVAADPGLELGPGVRGEAPPAVDRVATVEAPEDQIETIGERMLVTPELLEWTGEGDELRSVRPSVHRVVVLLPRVGAVGGAGASAGGGG
ncbi:MAG: hypothetical protein AAF356_12025 [Planctomycetota bacterium]